MTWGQLAFGLFGTCVLLWGIAKMSKSFDGDE